MFILHYYYFLPDYLTLILIVKYVDKSSPRGRKNHRWYALI